MVQFDRSSAERIARTVREHELTPKGPLPERRPLPPNVTTFAQFQLDENLEAATNSLTGAKVAKAWRLWPDYENTAAWDNATETYTPQHMLKFDDETDPDISLSIYVVNRSLQASAAKGTYGIAIFTDNEWLVVWLDCS
jgi:hypothetical protein